jgi:2-hydroxy-3-keto-5-methylthiopentenyl-1-phosphate phosphatase
MPLIAGETKLVVFSDFDGTITLNDSNGTWPLEFDWDVDRQII